MLRLVARIMFICQMPAAGRVVDVMARGRRVAASRHRINVSLARGLSTMYARQ